MTKRELRRLVAEYQERLLCAHWEIEIVFDSVPDVPTWDASIHWTYQYDQATLYIYPAWRKWTEARARRIIAHELIHLLERDLQVAVKDQEEHIGEGWDQFYVRWTHELEGLTERLATIIARADCA